MITLTIRQTANGALEIKTDDGRREALRLDRPCSSGTKAHWRLKCTDTILGDVMVRETADVVIAWLMGERELAGREL